MGHLYIALHEYKFISNFKQKCLYLCAHYKKHIINGWTFVLNFIKSQHNLESMFHITAVFYHIKMMYKNPAENPKFYTSDYSSCFALQFNLAIFTAIQNPNINTTINITLPFTQNGHKNLKLHKSRLRQQTTKISRNDFKAA